MMEYKLELTKGIMRNNNNAHSLEMILILFSHLLHTDTEQPCAHTQKLLLRAK